MNDVLWPIVFLAMGLALLSLELFVPSGGFIGFAAALCLILGLWNAFQTSQQLGMIFLLVDFVAVPITAVVAFRLWVKSPLGRRFTLAPPEPDEGDVSHATGRYQDLVGREGKAMTPLHPCGHVEVRGRRYDGMAEAGLIEEGSPVRVVRVRSGQLIVRAVDGLISAAEGRKADEPAAAGGFAEDERP